MKLLMIAVLMMEIAFLGGGNAFWNRVEVALQKLLWGGGGRQLEILVTTLHYANDIFHMVWY